MSDIIENSFAEWLLQEEEARIRYYHKCQRYYDGIHNVLTPDKYLDLVKRHYGIRINYCEPIVEAPVSRLTVEDISCDEPKTLEALRKIWKSNRMDAKTIKLHRNAIKKGDAFAQVWPHFAKGSTTPDRYEIKFLTPDIILPIYESDDSDSLMLVRKQWISYDSNGQPMAHKWLFYADRIERFYYSLNKNVTSMDINSFARLKWMPDDTDGFEPVLENPYGVIPIIPFRNKEDDSPFGTSELHNAFSVQDGINKLVVDLMRTADFQAFKQRYLIGVDEEELPVNPDTGRHELQSNPGDVWVFPPSGAENPITVGELSNTDPAGILASIDKLVDHLSSITRTPKSALQDSAGTASSGFALSKVEAPLLDKVREKQISFGNSYEDINKLLIVQMQFHGDLPKGEIPETSIEWESSTSESAEEKLYGAQRKQILKQNGVISAEQWAKEEGYTDEEIAQMQAEMKMESEESTASLLGHAFGNNNLE